LIDEILKRLDLEALTTQGVAVVMGAIPDLIVAVIFLIGFWILFKATEYPLRKGLHAAGLHATLTSMLVDSLYRYTVLGFGVVMAAGQMGVNIGAILASIGVAGIAIGFAAQDTLSNIIAGFLIFFDRPFTVGDWVHVAGQIGEVNEITMRTTRIKTKNNTWVVIPNKKIIDEVLVNHSKRGETRIDVPIGIAYKEYIPKAREVLLEAVKDLPGVSRQPPPEVMVMGLGGSSVDLEVRVWIDKASNEPPIACAVVEASKLALDAADIEIPFPHLQLFFEDVKAPVWKGLKELKTPDAA